MVLFKNLVKILNVRIYTNLYTLLIIIGAIYLYYSNLATKNTSDNSIVKYLDSINEQNKILLSRIDSLDLNKKEKLTVYHTTTLKYDTIKIIVDSMPPLDATLFLLSKSRQLTDKGIE